MNSIEKSIHKFDKLQRRYRFSAFSYAVIKRYGDMQTGYQAALLTYYGFVSLFPLLLVLTTITQLIASSHPKLQESIVSGTASYFPVLGDQLSAHVHTLHQSGPVLLVGVLFTLYGARGVAAAFRDGVNHIWGVPLKKRDHFPVNSLKNILIIIVGGAGFIGAAVLAGYTAGFSHQLSFHVLSVLINVFLLFFLFAFLMKVSLPSHVSFREIEAGAITAAIGLVVLQLLGGYLLAREMRNLDALYSYFAVALGLLFWIYLQAQVVYYAAQICVVSNQKLWPRSLSGQDLTDADHRELKAPN